MSDARDEHRQDSDASGAGTTAEGLKERASDLAQKAAEHKDALGGEENPDPADPDVSPR